MTKKPRDPAPQPEQAAAVVDFEARRRRLADQETAVRRDLERLEADPAVLAAVETGEEVPAGLAESIARKRELLERLGGANRGLDEEQARGMAAHRAAVAERARGDLIELQAAVLKTAGSLDRNLAAVGQDIGTLLLLAERGRRIADAAGFRREPWYALEDDRVRDRLMMAVFGRLRDAGLLGWGTLVPELSQMGATPALAATLSSAVLDYIPRSEPPEAA